jgi:hypothetical protein
MGHGGANAPGMAQGAGKGAARGGGFGFGHANVGNPGHNALSTRSSHSQNTSHKGGTHDGRSFSSHSHSTHSLAQHHADHSKKAEKVVQVDDRGAGKKKGFVDDLPPGQELQVDRGMTLNLEPIHSDLDDIVTRGLPPGQELQADRGRTLNPETIHSDLDDIVTRGLNPGQELQADRGKALNPDAIHSDLDDIVTLGLPPGRELQADRGKTLNLEPIHSDLDDIVTRGLNPGQELQADPGGALNSDTIRSDLDNIVTLGLPPGQELQADPGGTLNPETIHSDLDDIATRGLTPGIEPNFNRGKSLPASWPAKVGLWTIVPDTDDTPATTLPKRWELGDDRAKTLSSTNPELEDDDGANAGWKLVPYFAAALLFFSWIVQSGLDARKRKAPGLKFEPNPLRSLGSVNGARPPALDKFAAAFSIAGEGQQKAAEEKKGALLGHFSGDPDVEKARAEIEHAQEIEETFHKDFNGIGLS